MPRTSSVALDIFINICAAVKLNIILYIVSLHDNHNQIGYIYSHNTWYPRTTRISSHTKLLILTHLVFWYLVKIQIVRLTPQQRRLEHSSVGFGFDNVWSPIKLNWVVVKFAFFHHQLSSTLLSIMKPLLYSTDVQYLKHKEQSISFGWYVIHQYVAPIMSASVMERNTMICILIRDTTHTQH